MALSRTSGYLFCSFLLLVLVSCSGYEAVSETDALGYRSEFSVDPETGLRQGAFRQFSPTGQLVAEAHYTDGELDGRRILYHPNGEIDVVENYAMGEFDGEYLRHDEEGNLQERGFYSDGAMNKVWTYYYPDGGVRQVVTFVDNAENGPFRGWHENGQPKVSGTLIDGNYEHGILHKYDPTGQLERVMDCDRARCYTSWTRDSTHTPRPGVDMTRPEGVTK